MIVGFLNSRRIIATKFAQYNSDQCHYHYSAELTLLVLLGGENH